MFKIKVSVGPFSLAEGSRGGSVLAFFFPISFFFFRFIYLLANLGLHYNVQALHCCVWLCLARASRCSGFSYCRAPAPVVVAHGPRCPAACGILLPRPEIKPVFLPWQGDSQPLDHQGSPTFFQLLVVANNPWSELTA